MHPHAATALKLLWGVFSTNIIIPGFHSGALQRLEVFDRASDLAIADFSGKPFLLPQEDPHHYGNCLKSYNIPDLGATPVPFDSDRIAEIREDTEAEQFR